MRCSTIVRQRKYEQQRDRENATHEREKLLLRLENALLRFERRLPPGSSTSGSLDSVLPDSGPGVEIISQERGLCRALVAAR